MDSKCAIKKRGASAKSTWARLESPQSNQTPAKSRIKIRFPHKAPTPTQVKIRFVEMPEKAVLYLLSKRTLK
jgi:hypothetical protein